MNKFKHLNYCIKIVRDNLPNDDAEDIIFYLIEYKKMINQIEKK